MRLYTLILVFFKCNIVSYLQKQFTFEEVYRQSSWSFFIQAHV